MVDVHNQIMCMCHGAVSIWFGRQFGYHYSNMKGSNLIKILAKKVLIFVYFSSGEVCGGQSKDKSTENGNIFILLAFEVVYTVSLG